MNGAAAVSALKNVKTFFDTTTKSFDEKDSSFTPKSEMFTVAHHVAHTAQTVDWFLEGALRPEGFDLDFAAHEAKVRKVTSLKDARAWWERSMKTAMTVLGGKSPAELAQPLPEGIMAGAPLSSILTGIADHTAHHRGALAVYARLLGKVPAMPYGG
ncbi:MAG: DinB family protein [bacterium]